MRGLFHGFDYAPSFTGAAAGRLGALAGGADHVLGLSDGQRRFLDAMAALGKPAGIALHLEGARPLHDDVG